MTNKAKLFCTCKHQLIANLLCVHTHTHTHHPHKHTHTRAYTHYQRRPLFALCYTLYISISYLGGGVAKIVCQAHIVKAQKTFATAETSFRPKRKLSYSTKLLKLLQYSVSETIVLLFKIISFDIINDRFAFHVKSKIAQCNEKRSILHN